MDQLYFLKPFALSGDRVAIPMTVDPGGQVSYDQGWGVDYQRDPTTDPNAKDIDRAQTNYLMWSMTLAIKAWQENTYPEWITNTQNGGVAFPYPAGTIVKYRATTSNPFVTYVATPERASQPNSTSVPGTDLQWKQLAIRTADQAESVAMLSDSVLMTPLQTKYAVAQYITALNLKAFATGQFVAWAADTPPAGTLVCNGAAVSRTTYANLFAIIGTRYGAGDGATTFNLPNLNPGDTIRQTDGLAGTNFPMYARNNGAVISHTHANTLAAAGGHTHTAGTSGAGGHTHSGGTDTQGSHYHNASSDQQGYHGHSFTTAAAGDHAHAQNPNTTYPGYGNNRVSYQGAQNAYLNYDGGNTQNAGTHAHTGNTDGNGTHAHNISMDTQGAHAHNLSINGVGDHTHPVTVNSVGDHTHVLTNNAFGITTNTAAGINVLFVIAF